MRVLGIETSCDETGIALYDSERGLLADSLYSQVALHERFGGVIPELASRDHIRKTLPLIQEVLDKAGATLADIDGIAYTAGPGLIGALLVGASLGRALGMALEVPTIGVHHMEGHLLAPMLEDTPPEFPFVALLVSGGHTQLVRVDGTPGRFEFPRPMTNRPGLEFSFSGLKTAVRNTLAEERVRQHADHGARNMDEQDIDEQTRADIARAFEDAVVQTFVIKCRRALQATGLKSLIIAGGVSANLRLREGLQGMVEKERSRLFYAKPRFCTDNGAMIAYAGCQRLLAGETEGLALDVRPRWPLESLSPLGQGGTR